MKPQPIRDFALLTLAAVVGIFAAILDWPLTAWARRKNTEGGRSAGVPTSQNDQGVKR